MGQNEFILSIRWMEDVEPMLSCLLKMRYERKAMHHVKMSGKSAY